jgi:integrase
MPGRQAKYLSPSMIRRMLRHVRATSAYPERDIIIILLSVKAGLRACEIVGLDWPMVLDARGRIGHVLSVHDAIAKKRHGRTVPMHPDLKAALARLQNRYPCQGPLLCSARGGRLRANSVVNWFVVLFQELGFEGCSSHSGRRTFITTAARNLHKAGCSLRDVQILAGHSSIEMTQRYIDGDSDGQRRLVGLL